MRSIKNNIKNIFWILPLFIIYCLLIGGGLIQVFIESLGYIPTLGLTEMSGSSYYKFFADRSTYESIIYAFYLAISSSFLSCVLGVLLAYQLTTSQKDYVSRFVRKILKYAIILPYLYMTFVTLLLFSRTGILSRLLFNIGIIDKLEQFPQLLYGSSGIGVIFVFVLKGVPFVTLYVINIMDKIKGDFQSVAATLGANKLQQLRYLYLPLCSNAIVWSTIILFAYYMGAFEVPFLFLGQSNVPLSVKLYSAYINPQIKMIPNAMAMSVLLMFVGTIGTGLYAYLLKKILLWQIKL